MNNRCKPTMENMNAEPKFPTIFRFHTVSHELNYKMRTLELLIAFPLRESDVVLEPRRDDFSTMQFHERTQLLPQDGDFLWGVTLVSH